MFKLSLPFRTRSAALAAEKLEAARRSGTPTAYLAMAREARDRRDEALDLWPVAVGVADDADRAEAMSDLAKLGLAP